MSTSPRGGDLFDEVRRRCPSEAWTLGVSLARGGAVSLRSSDDEEVVARVAVAGSTLTPTVSLFPGDGDWECDCSSPLHACEHVAAVVIAARQGFPGRAETSEARPIVYRLRRAPAGLHFERGVEEGGTFHAIEFPLAAMASGTFEGPRFEATPHDLDVEKALRGRLRGVLDRGALARVFTALASVRDVTLDGAPVTVSGQKMTPPVVVEDEGAGFRLALSESRPDGFVVESGRLKPVAEPELTGREREELERGRHFGPEEVGALVGEVLPSLRRRVPVEVRTTRLPEATKSKPELVMALHRNGNSLYVLPQIRYPETYPLRDVAAEQVIGETLKRRFGLALDRGVELGADEAVAFVAGLEGVAVEGEGIDAFRNHGVLAPHVGLDPGSFEARFDVNGRAADPRAVLRVWREGQSVVPLVDGGFAEIPQDWLDRCGDTLADLLAARREDGSLGPASRPELARLAEELDLPPAPPAVEMAEPSPIPSELEPHLRDYQRKGVSWLLLLRSGGLGGLLADDMGLGKTLQALGALEGRRRSLVVAPTSVVVNWVAEARRFRPGLSVGLYHGRERKLDETVNVTVTSHALLRLDADVLAGVDWDTLVIDEAQAIRNPDTDLARAACRLRARSRISLTGTPIENRLSDLWSQFHFLDRGFLGSREDFEERYVKPVERGAVEPLERLKERIRPFYLRRLKAEVAPELPPRTEITLHVTLSEEERAVYDAVRLAARRDVLQKLEQGKNVLAVLEALLRLRQAACHAALVPGQSASSSSKTELLMETLETTAAEGHKALVFSQWTSMLDLLEGPLDARGLAFFRLDGTTRDRAAVVERFQSDDRVPVFLLSLKAGGTGLNLTAADHVFLFDPWWNPAVEEQAFDRAHRIGQDKPVFLHRLVADDTVEEKILALQETKRRVASMAAGASGATVTKEELLALLE